VILRTVLVVSLIVLLEKFV
jgi:hypothetical protein